MADTCEHDWNRRLPDDSPTWRKLVYRTNILTCTDVESCTAGEPCPGCQFWIDSGKWRDHYDSRDLVKYTYLVCLKCGRIETTMPPNFW